MVAKQTITQSSEKKPLCLICHGEPSLQGVFVPNQELCKELQLPPGKLRVGFHFLCQTCARRPDTPARVDAFHVGQLRALAAKERAEREKP